MFKNAFDCHEKADVCFPKTLSCLSMFGLKLI